MQRVSYTSTFTTPVDLITGSLMLVGLGPPQTLDEAYAASSTLHEKLYSEADSWCQRNEYTSFADCLEADRNAGKIFHEIESDCGDDEVITTNSKAYGPLRITGGITISGIRLSEKDSGISSQIFNYTEGWIITPPTKESCYEAVTRRHQSQGVPFLLDPVKLKFISPVRKQSKMELDLESKIDKVFEHASWVGRWQFSYDYHQLMKILAVNIFDYRDARSFPYLYESEGGCGGLPPWGNLDTTLSGIHAFHKGKASRTIYGLMSESVQIHMGELEPRSSFFLRSSHIAQLGDSAWLTYDSVFRELKEGKTPTEAANILSVLANKNHLPPEILEKGAEIEPENVVMGTAIAHLRQDKFVMTELDVKLQLENRKKILALGGTVPFRIILQEVEDEKENIKSNSFKVLAEIADFIQADGNLSLATLNSIPNESGDYFERRKIMQDYYVLRTERFTQFSSFAYSDAIRVFKTSDVLSYISKHGNVLRETIGAQISPTLRVALGQDILAERLRKEAVLDWISSNDLAELLKAPLPAGIGPDDGRIMNEIVRIVDGVNASETYQNPPVVILLSGDRALGRGIHGVLKKRHPDKNWLMFQMDQTQYIGVCLQECRRIQMDEPEFEPRNNVRIWNYIRSMAMVLPKDIILSIRKRVRELKAQDFTPYVVYDFPNLERAIEPSTYQEWNSSVVTKTGGYLRAETIKNFPPLTSWGALPLDKVSQFADFSQSRRIRYPIRKIDWGSRAYYNKPLSPGYLAEVSRWTHSIGS